MGTTIQAVLSVIALGVGIDRAIPGQAGDRSLEKILAELDAIKLPRFDARKAEDKELNREYLAKRAEVWARQDALTLELYKIAPHHERIPRLMYLRWSRMTEPFEKLYKDVDEVLAHDKNPKLRVEGTYCKARAKLWQSRSSSSLDRSSFEDFAKAAPGDPRGAALLRDVIARIGDEKLKATLAKRIVRDDPTSPEGRRILGERQQARSLGKPFELEFADAITGSPVSMKNLRGKVVAIDFWATWCGPCVTEIPHMKELYAKYRSQGVEFIGVSLAMIPELLKKSRTTAGVGATASSN
jgi:thiol-disulfide isomerase/thioredoxin